MSKTDELKDAVEPMTAHQRAVRFLLDHRERETQAEARLQAVLDRPTPVNPRRPGP